MTRRHEALTWVGVLVAPVAWAVQHVLVYFVSEANCDVVGRQWNVAFSGWVAAATAVAAVLAVAALASAVFAFRAIKDADVDADPPPGRVWLMSICGIVISPIFLGIILLDGTGALLLGHCHQG